LRDVRLRDALIPKFRYNEKETRFKNTKTGRHRDSVKILDFEYLNLVLFVVNCDLEEVTILALKEEKESTLRKNINQDIATN
jgi:hypothetical protein